MAAHESSLPSGTGPATRAKVVVVSKEEADEERAGIPRPFLCRSRRRTVLLLSLRPIRTSPRLAYSVPKIGKGSFSPLGPDPCLLSGRAAFPIASGAVIHFANRSWGYFRLINAPAALASLDRGYGLCECHLYRVPRSSSHLLRSTGCVSPPRRARHPRRRVGRSLAIRGMGLLCPVGEPSRCDSSGTWA